MNGIFKNGAILAVCAGLILTLVIGVAMHLLTDESFLGPILTWSVYAGSDDSWGPMEKALKLLGQHPAGLLYDDLFFRQHVKFQYPLTSLLYLSALTPFFGAGTMAVAKAIGWAAVPFTVFAAGFFCMLLVQRTFAKLPKWETIAIGVLTMAATMVFYPVMKAFDLGQIQTWANALFALSCLCWVLNGRRAAGVCIGLICLIKPQFSLFLLWGLIRKQWKFLQGWGAVVIAGGIASIALYGFAHNLNYLKVLSMLSKHGESFYANHSLNGLLNRMFFNGPNLGWAKDALPEFSPYIYGATVATSIVLMLLALFWRSRYAKVETLSMPMLLDYMGAALTFTMASPIAWEHHYGILPPVLIAAFIAASSFADKRLRAGLWLLLGASYVLVSNYLPVTKALATGPLNFLQSYLFFGALMLLGVVYWLRGNLLEKRLQESASKSFLKQEASDEKWMSAIKKLFRRLAADQRFRFLLAGGFAAFVNWAVRFPLSLVMPFAAAVAVAMGIGMVVGFVIYRRYVFPASSRRTWKQVRDFIAVNAVGMVVTVAVAVGLKYLLLPHVPGQEALLEAFCHAAGIAAGAVANYFGHRDVTFRA